MSGAPDVLNDADDGVLTVEVNEDDLVEGAPPPREEPEDLPIRPQPLATGGPAPRSQPRGADILRQQLERSSGLVESLQGANQRAQSELARQRQENAELKRSHTEDQRSTLTNTIASIDAGLEQAEQAYAAAFESGIGADVAKAQRRLTELTTKRQEVERQLGALPSQEELKKQVETATQPRTAEERIEAYISQFSPKSQEWLRAHQDFITDRSRNQRLLDTHKQAVAQNLEPDTDEYFAFLNRRLGVDAEPARRQPTNGGGQEPQPMKRSSTPVRASAPVRGGTGISVQGTRSVRLNEEEIRNATDGTLAWDYDDPSGKNRFKKGDPIGVNEMARRKALIKAGKAGKLRYMSDAEA